MNELGILDTFGVPEFFVTEVGAIENAGGGNMRVIRCIKRGGVLIPVFSIVTPMECLITSAAIVREYAQDLFNSEMTHASAAAH